MLINRESCKTCQVFVVHRLRKSHPKELTRNKQCLVTLTLYWHNCIRLSKTSQRRVISHSGALRTSPLTRHKVTLIIFGDNANCGLEPLIYVDLSYTNILTGFSKNSASFCINCAASAPSLTRWSTEMVAFMREPILI